MCVCVCVCCEVFDHNGDGYISKLELHKTMNELGIELSREDLDAMMDEADVNKDGRIDYAGQSVTTTLRPRYDYATTTITTRTC